MLYTSQRLNSEVEAPFSHFSYCLGIRHITCHKVRKCITLFVVRDGYSRHSCPKQALAFHARAGFRHLCREKPISQSKQCHMHIVTVADPGFGGRGGVKCHRQGRSPCSRHEVASGGSRGSRGGVSSLPRWNENGNQKMLRWLLKHSKIRIL